MTPRNIEREINYMSAASKCFFTPTSAFAYYFFRWFIESKSACQSFMSLFKTLCSTSSVFICYGLCCLTYFVDLSALSRENLHKTVYVETR